MEWNKENIDKWKSVWINSSISAKSNERMCFILLDLIVELINENDLNLRQEFIQKIRERISNSEEDFLKSRVSEEFPDHVAAVIEGDATLVEQLLSRLSRDDSDTDSNS